MKTTSDHFAVKAGAGAGFFAMTLVGWNLVGGPASPAAGKSQAVAPAGHSARTPRPQRSSGINAAAVQQLAAIRSGRNPSERMRATVDFANSLSPADFPAWLDGGWFSLRDGAELTLFTKIIQERWKSEDPEGYAAWTLNKGSTDEASKLLASWADKEPQRVVDFFKLQSNSGSELQILRDLAKTHPALALQCLRDLNAAGFSRNDSYPVSTVIEELVKKSPAEVEALVGELTGDVKVRTERVVIGEKMKADYAGELRKLWDRTDGLKIFQNLGNEIQGKIFDELANLPPSWRAGLVSDPSEFISRESALKWMNSDLLALGFSEKQEQAIHQSALYQAAREHPEDAFKMMDELNLSPNDRRNIIGNALGVPRDKMDAVVAMLTSESDREIARSILDSRSASSSPAEKIETPAQWLDKIATLNPESGGTYQYASMVSNWDAAKISALSEQFKSLPDDKKKAAAQIIAGGGYSSYFSPAIAGEATRYLIVNPLPPPAVDANGNPGSTRTDPIRMASSYVGGLAAKDPESASEWISTLPDGDAKAWSQMNLRAIWSQYDPKASDQWFKTLPAATRLQVENLKKKPGN